MNRRTVLITGAGGFLGLQMGRMLETGGHRIVGMDFVSRPQSWPGDWHPLRVGEDTPLEHELLSRSDAVIHAAWAGKPSNKAPFEDDFSNNILPTLEFYTRACANGVERFIFLSSGGTVYGEGGGGDLIEESCSLAPIGLYGASKAATEIYLNTLARELGAVVTILRIANPYGPGQMPWQGQGVIPTAIACALTDTEFAMWSSPRSTRDYLFIDDLLDAVRTVIETGGPAGTFNIGSGVAISLADVIATIEGCLGRRLAVSRSEGIGAHVSQNVLSIDKIRASYDWTPQVSFAAGIQHCVDWLERNRASWEGSAPASAKAGTPLP